MIIRIFVFLLLGAIVNVAVAWGFAAVAPLSTRANHEPDYFDPADDSDAPDAPGAWVVWSFQQIGCEYFYTTWDTKPMRNYMRTVGMPPGAIPHWASDIAPTIENRRTLPGERQALAFGWPCLSVRCFYECGAAARPAAFVLRGGLRLPHFIVPSGNSPYLFRTYRALPLMPIWPGFAINTLFYAAILWLLFAAPFALRRRRRIKRGMCAKCGYDLRGSATDMTACPECGAVRSAHKPATDDDHAFWQNGRRHDARRGWLDAPDV